MVEKATKIGFGIVTALIIISLLIAVAENNATSQRLIDVDNETIALTDNQTGQFSNADIQVVTTLLNTTDLVDVSNICNVTLSTGVIQCNNTHDVNVISNYTYYPSTYVKSSSSRTLVLLVSIILIIAVILTFVRAMKRET